MSLVIGLENEQKEDALSGFGHFVFLWRTLWNGLMNMMLIDMMRCTLCFVISVDFNTKNEMTSL